MALPTSNLKRSMVDTLADYLAARPELAALAVRAVQADYEDELTFPHLVVMPRRMEFDRLQEFELDDTVPGKVLMYVGDMVGNVELRLGGLSAYEREDYEQRVLDIFNGEELAPGVLSLQGSAMLAGGTQFGVQPTFAFELAGEDWSEEMVFTSPRYSFITLDAQGPLVVSRPAYTIDQLILCSTIDTLITVLTTDDIDEQRQVNEDGSTTSL